MTEHGGIRRSAIALIVGAILGAGACSHGGSGPDGGAATRPASPAAGPIASVEQSRARVLDGDTAPEGLKLLRPRPSDPTPGAAQGWRGGWTTQSLVLPPGIQRRGWEWAQSTVNVYADAADAVGAFDLTKEYVVSAYAGSAEETDPEIGERSVAIEATRNAPDVTVLWREGNVVTQLSGFGGPPLTNDDVVALAKRLAATPLSG
jgi:hypothetical protein